jgi:hypothetical protein
MYEYTTFVKCVFALFSTFHQKYASPKVLENVGEGKLQIKCLWLHFAIGNINFVFREVGVWELLHTHVM